MYIRNLQFPVAELRVAITKELAELMKSGKAPNMDFVVVDVRDDDYAGGNIKGCLHLPSREFLTNVDSLVKQTKEVPVVIFHCALSQVR
jgi:Cdc25 family phosphatase